MKSLSKGTAGINVSAKKFLNILKPKIQIMEKGFMVKGLSTNTQKSKILNQLRPS